MLIMYIIGRNTMPKVKKLKGNEITKWYNEHLYNIYIYEENHEVIGYATT